MLLFLKKKKYCYVNNNVDIVFLTQNNLKEGWLMLFLIIKTVVCIMCDN